MLKSSPVTLKRASQTHAVRIIAGQYRRRLLPVVDAPGLRPTPDRVRQTVFNWIDHFAAQRAGGWAALRVVDAFAGTGALGFEAASRGAVSVLLCECHASAARHLQASAALLQAAQCTVQRGDALAILAALPAGSVDLLLLDAPFDQDWPAKLRPLAARVLATQGLVYLESEAQQSWAGFELLRQLKAGAVHAQLLMLAAALG